MRAVACACGKGGAVENQWMQCVCSSCVCLCSIVDARAYANACVSVNVCALRLADAYRCSV